MRLSLEFLVALPLVCSSVLPATLRPAAVAPEVTSLISNDGTYFLTYASEPAVVPLNEVFAVEVSVFTDEKRREPAVAVELAFDARMPQHGHGMRREPRVQRLGDGRFRVEGVLLHMPGYWELYFDATRGALTERAQDSLVVD
ncbi:MAG: hypothetical protein CMJ84_02745 [Planctomycetes bacterium]|jgi:hypothetical protein|nr:hypothetical protein [Planctomycetota bacterium]MDP6409840.1 hypothetical protein [Planctomycetota bacterium]